MHQGSLGHLVATRSRRRRAGALLGALVELPGIGPLVLRAGQAPMRIPAVAHRVTRLHAWLLRRSGGRLRRSWVFAAGQPVISLTTTGRRSGLARSTAVACFRDGEDLVVAGMNLGMPGDPAWALNLRAHPAATIEIDGRRLAVLAEPAAGADAQRLWERWCDLQPSAPAFRELAGRPIPLFVLRPAQATP